MRKRLVKTFAVFTVVAIVLNVRAASIAMGRGWLLIAAGYVVIALALAGALFLLWYTSTQQTPYRWRELEPEGSVDDERSAASDVDWWREEFDVEPLDDDLWNDPLDDDLGRSQD
jgi:fatty acid desaturase